LFVQPNCPSYAPAPPRAKVVPQLTKDFNQDYETTTSSVPKQLVVQWGEGNSEGNVNEQSLYKYTPIKNKAKYGFMVISSPLPTLCGCTYHFSI
jgi:hypothetical protein